MAGYKTSEKTARQYQRRRAHQNREWRARGSESRPAGPCKRIDPQTGEAVIMYRLEAVPLAVARPVIGMPKIKRRDESRAARLLVARVQACRKRAGKPGKPHRAVAYVEYDGRWLTLLIAHGYLAEDHPVDGQAFDKALRAANTALVAELVAEKIRLTR